MNKKNLLIILIAIISLASCKKVTVTPGLIGKWELRKKMGSIVGFDSVFAAGNGRVLEFRGDSTYLQYNKGRLLIQGKYHIATTNYPSANSLSITFENGGYQDYFNLTGTTLQIGMDANDGVETDYQKIAN